MTTATLDHWLEELKVLTPEDRLRLRDAIDVSLGESTLEDEVERALFDAGLLSELRPPPDRMPAYVQFEPIAVSGKPVSETIIEERR